MSDARLFEFRSKQLDVQRVDWENGVLHGVAVIECGIKAKGHELHVDEKTLAQMLAEGKRQGQVPAKLNHGSGYENLFGDLRNFRIDGKILRADLHANTEHREFKKTFKDAEDRPKVFGMSVAFRGEPEKRGNQMFARCEDLKAVDMVVDPAAVTNGLFQERVDRRAGGMPGEINFQELLDGQKAILEKLTQFEGQLSAVSDRVEDLEEENEPIDLSSLSQEDIEALEAAGYQLLDEEGEPMDDAGDDDEGGNYGGEFSHPLEAKIAQLEALVDNMTAQLNARAQSEQEFAERQVQEGFEGKVELLITQLEEAKAKNAAYERALKIGGATVSFDAETDTPVLTMNRGRKGAKRTDFDVLVDGLKDADKENRSRVFHFDQAVRKYPDLYEEHLRAEGCIQ